jgi:CDGSH-type Zn-finger protein
MNPSHGKGEAAGTAPIGVDVVAGRTYWWCACGLSKQQPFCDGSHKATALTPVEYKADANRKLFFCVCKQTDKRPLCDGSHKKL